MAEDNSSFMNNLGSFTTIEASDEMESFLNGDENPPVKKESKKPEEVKKEEPKKEQAEPEESQEDIDAELDEFLDSDEDAPEVKKPKKQDVKKDEDKEEDESDEDFTDKESQTFSILAKELLDKGLFTLDEDEEDLNIVSEGDFMDRFDYEARKLAGKALDGLFSSKGQKAKDAVQAIIIDGVDPEDYFSRTVEIENLEEFDLSSEDNQKAIIRQYYKKLGRKDDAIDIKIQRLENIGELADESKDAHTFLLDAKRKDFDNLKVTQAAEAQRKAQEKQIYQNKINEVLSDKFKEKQFDGIPLDKKTLDSVSNYLKESNQTSNGHRFSNFDKDLMDLNKPENVAKKVKVALLLQLMESDPYLSKIQKKKESQKSTSLYNKLASSSKRTVQDSRAFSDL